MMCKVLIFGCIAAVILMTAAYGSPLKTERPLTRQEELLTASINDLEQLKNIENNFLDFYTPDDKQEKKVVYDQFKDGIRFAGGNTVNSNTGTILRMKPDLEECNRTTLECYLRELKVLKEDVEKENQRHIINIERNLGCFKVGNFSNPTCKKCESHEKKKFPEFRQELKSFLQSMLRENA